jgi:hypothetical protein
MHLSGGEWIELESELADIKLTIEEDSVKWALTSHGQFTVHSLYTHLTFSGIKDLKMEELWHSKMPLKIKNFVWLVLRNRVQTTYNVGRKQWRGNKLCQFCQIEESADHLFFKCPGAVFVWPVLQDGLGWSDVPKSV